MKAIPEDFVGCFGIYTDSAWNLLNTSKKVSAMISFTLKKKKITGTL